jgi:hypothetical protein
VNSSFVRLGSARSSEERLANATALACIVTPVPPPAGRSPPREPHLAADDDGVGAAADLPTAERRVVALGPKQNQRTNDKLFRREAVRSGLLLREALDEKPIEVLPFG